MARVCNVLVVEDDENSFLYLKITLESRNFNVYKATNGLEAINIFKDSQVQFDLVLMDLKLPIIDGYLASTEIRKIQPDVPIIIQTATYIPHDSNKLNDSKIDALLMKPFSVNTLLDAIESVLEIKEYH